MTTFSDLILRTERVLSQVEGTSVQIYAEDRIAEYLQQTFDFVFKEMWWDDYMQYFERTLDGTQGVVTKNLDDIREWTDIRTVFREDSDIPLRGLPSQINPFKMKGDTPRFISRHEDDSRLIQFWPKTATGKVYIHARVHPGEFDNQTDVRMDDLLLINGAAFMYAEDDGTNPGAIQKFQNLFERRQQQLRRERNNQPVDFAQHRDSIPLDWEEGSYYR